MKTRYRTADTVTSVPENVNLVQEAGANLLFYKNGTCRLGNRTFAYGVALDDVEFDAGCFVARRLDEMEFIYVRERGRLGEFHTRKFRYHRWHRIWYEYTPLNDRRFVADLNKYGEFLTRLRCEVKDGLHAMAVAYWQGFVALLLVASLALIAVLAPIVLSIFGLVFKKASGFLLV